jgi:hypothetical protein
MASSMESVSEQVRATLESLSAEGRQRFLNEKQKYAERQVGESPLLDQLCCLRVVMTELAEGQEQALTEFETTLERRMKMRGGWRKSVIRKVTGEYESPMPWMHPFKLAREGLQPLEQDWEAAIAKGETGERDWASIQQVLEEHRLELPLSEPPMLPEFMPGGVRVYK